MFGQIRKILKKQFEGESKNVFRGMVTLLIGAGFARIVGIASIPILTRIYSPEDYGVLAIYTAIVAVLVPFFTLRYVTAIPLPKTDAIAFNLFVLCVKLIFFSTVTVTVILFFFGGVIFDWFSMKEHAYLWCFITIGAMGASTYELFSMWATRQKDYKIIAKTQFLQSVIGSLFKIGLGLLSFKSLGLVLGQIFTQSGGVGSYFNKAIQDFKTLRYKLNYKQQKLLIKYYRGFPLFRLPSQFLLVLSSQAPIMMMAFLYDKEVTGQLSLAMMALSLPVGLVGQAMAKAYYAEIASIGKKDLAKIRRITVNVQKKLFILGVPAALLIFFTAEPLFEFAFGKDWEMAGKFASILSPYILLQFTSNPLIQVLNVIGSQFLFLIINAVRVLGLALMLMITIKVDISANVFVKTLSFYLFSYYLIMSLIIVAMVNKSVIREN